MTSGPTRKSATRALSWEEEIATIQILIGALLVVIGALAASNVVEGVNRAGRLWPRDFTRGDAHNMVSLGFLIRWMGLMVALIGVGLIWLSLT